MIKVDSNLHHYSVGGDDGMLNRILQAFFKCIEFDI